MVAFLFVCRFVGGCLCVFYREWAQLTVGERKKKIVPYVLRRIIWTYSSQTMWPLAPQHHKSSKTRLQQHHVAHCCSQPPNWRSSKEPGSWRRLAWMDEIHCAMVTDPPASTAVARASESSCTVWCDLLHVTDFISLKKVWQGNTITEWLKLEEIFDGHLVQQPLEFISPGCWSLPG